MAVLDGLNFEATQAGARRASALLKSMGNAHRLMILCQLVQTEHSVGELERIVGLSPSALSQHLARMRDEGLITFRREAQTLYYRIENPNVAKLIGTLKDIFCP